MALGVIACIDTSEMGRMGLGKLRSFDGSKMRSWGHTHPEYLRFVKPEPNLEPNETLQYTLLNSLPFRRYLGTGIEIIYMPTGEQVDFKTWTVRKHRDRLAIIPAYNPHFYFSPTKL